MGDLSDKMNQELVHEQIERFGNSKYVKNKEEKYLFCGSAETLAQVESFPELPADFSQDLVRLVNKYKEDYNSFLREQKDSGALDEARKYAELYFQKFKSEVDKIKKIKNSLITKNYDKIPGYLGQGGGSVAIRVDVDGAAYAVKFSCDSSQLEVLQKAKGLANTSQLVTYSFEDNVIVMELLPGDELSNCNKRPDYTDNHIRDLIGLVIELDKRGLSIDPKQSNFMYDKEQGFSILDYMPKGEWPVADAVMYIITPLTLYEDDKLTMDLLFSRNPSDMNECNRLVYPHRLDELEMTSRFLYILKDNFPDIFAEVKKNQQNKENIEKIVEGVTEYANSFDNAQEKMKPVDALTKDIKSLGLL